MVFGLFDQQMSEGKCICVCTYVYSTKIYFIDFFFTDDLFNRLTISEILSQVANLKQQGSLHEV